MTEPIDNSSRNIAEERQLIEGILAGARDDFRILVERYQNRIFAMIYRQVGDRDLSEELAQEVFIKAYRALASFKFDAQFSTWLTTIALNTTKTFFTSKRWRELKNSRELTELEYKSEPENTVAEEEYQLLKLRSAIAEIESPFKEILILCGIEERSYEQAACILKIPIGTVRSRLNKARLLLKDKFNELINE